MRQPPTRKERRTLAIWTHGQALGAPLLTGDLQLGQNSLRIQHSLPQRAEPGGLQNLGSLEVRCVVARVSDTPLTWLTHRVDPTERPPSLPQIRNWPGFPGAKGACLRAGSPPTRSRSHGSHSVVAPKPPAYRRGLRGAKGTSLHIPGCGTPGGLLPPFITEG